MTIEYNSRLNNFFGCAVAQSVQTKREVKQEISKNFRVRLDGKVFQVDSVCPCCGSWNVVHNGNDKCKSRIIRELGLVIKRGKFLCKKCGKTWTTRFKDAEIFVREFKELINATVFHWCCNNASLSSIKDYVAIAFSRNICRDWINKLYNKACSVIEKKNILKTSGIFHYDEQHLKENGKEVFRVVVLDAISKNVIFDERTEDKKIETLKDELRSRLLPYKKESFVVDLALGYPAMLEELYPGVRIQWCIFHLNQLIMRDFAKLLPKKQKIFPLQEYYNQYLMLNLFMDHEVEVQFLKRQLKKLDQAKKILKGCCSHSIKPSSKIPVYERTLIRDFIEFRKGLKKNRRKNKGYLIKHDKEQTMRNLRLVERDIAYFPKPIQKRIKMIRKNIDKLTLFQEKPLVPSTNNTLEQYNSATLQKTQKKRFRSKIALQQKLKIIREKWNKTLGQYKFNFYSFMQTFAKLQHLFHPT